MKPAILFALLFPSLAFADTAQLVENALSAKADPADPAIVALRAAGPEAFRELERRLEPKLKAYLEARILPGKTPTAETQLAADLLSAASGQHDCYASRLYWFTDFEAAKAEAKRLNRPIVSLRMMGKLTDEFSCANSRLFRSLLYTDPKIGALLRDKFVLHWESVRPVPQVTVDYGDGRVLRRTVTGNSIHYILTPSGKIADALPGMYQPNVFLKELTESADFLSKSPGDAAIASRLQEKRGQLLQAWNEDLVKVGVLQVVNEPIQSGGFPKASTTMENAFSKGRVETPVVSVIEGTKLAQLPKLPETATYLRVAESGANREDPTVWEKIGQLHRDNSVSPAARDFMLAKMPDAIAASNLTASKMVVESPLLKMVSRLETSLAADTVRNQYDFRPKILERLTSAGGSDLNELNDWVYASLFLTPKEDPWLGLRSNDVFSALENDGIEISQ